MWPQNQNINVQPSKQRLTRRTHIRSRLGCPTCKKRRIKCDETLPICKNCQLSNKLRCGYLDYTPDQLEMIRLSHLEASNKEQQQASSSTLSQQDSFDPTKEIEVIHNFLHSKEVNLNSTSSKDDFNVFNTPSSSDQSSPKSNDIIISLAPHNLGVPDPSKIPIYFNETQGATVIRYLTIHGMFTRMLFATTEILSFYGILVLGNGILLAKLPKTLMKFYLRTKGKCLDLLLKNIPYLNDDNLGSLLNLSTCLDISFVYLKSEAGSYKSHFQLNIGPSSILEKLYSDPELFPKSFERVTYYADYIVNTIRFLWIPQYDFKILFEFKEVVENFGQNYILNSSFETLKLQFNHIIEVITFSIDLFQNNYSNDLVIKYPIEKIYDLYQLWFSLFPSEGSALDNSKMSGVEKVFYVFWFNLAKILEALIVNSCYIFSYFLTGYFFIQPFNKSDITKTLEKEQNDGLTWNFNYCARMISFLDRRILYAMEVVVAYYDPLFIFYNLKDRLKARPLNSNEKCVIKFKNKIIRRNNYPRRIKGAIVSYADDNIENKDEPSTSKEIDVKNELDIEFVQLKNELDEIEAESENDTIDLLHGVNPVTSMLYVDYDPRFSDPILMEDKYDLTKLAKVDLIRKYIEDRKAIVNMIDE